MSSTETGIQEVFTKYWFSSPWFLLLSVTVDIVNQKKSTLAPSPSVCTWQMSHAYLSNTQIEYGNKIVPELLMK